MGWTGKGIFYKLLIRNFFVFSLSLVLISFPQSKPKAEKNHANGLLFSENSCQLCGVEKLTFDPPLIYCSKCGSRIKRSVMYYTRGIGDTRHLFCIQCISEARGELVEIDGNPVPKSWLEKKENDEETEEGVFICLF